MKRIIAASLLLAASAVVAQKLTSRSKPAELNTDAGIAFVPDPARPVHDGLFRR